MATLTVNRTVAAPAELVFDILTDHRGYARITPLRSSTLEREGEPAPNGVGAIRDLRLAGPPIREEVTAFERPTRFSYKMLSGAPIRTYDATVDLAADGQWTRVTWKVDSTPSIPVPDGAWVAIIRLVITQLLNGIAKESERRARAGT